jgi:hypothetical protein
MVTRFQQAVRAMMMTDPAAAATAPTPLTFGWWLPDLMELNVSAFNQLTFSQVAGAVEALNVIPYNKGYVPFKSLNPSNTALKLNSPCIGAIVVDTPRDDVRLYAGTAQGLYAATTTGFTPLFVPDYILYNLYQWRFVPYGTNLVAIHPQVLPQISDMTGIEPFRLLGGGPPVASCGARVGDFLMLGNTQESDGYYPNRIRWSGFDNIEQPWITDPGTQSDFQDMPTEGGTVTGITGWGITGTVFQRKSISTLSYAGLPTVFDIATTEINRGAMCTGGIVNLGPRQYFIAEDGFFVWNGTNSTPIGSDRVNRYFFRKLNYKYRSQIVSTIDAMTETIWWAFPTGKDGTLTEVMIYSYIEDRWAHAIFNLQFLVQSMYPGQSLDDLKGNLDNGYPVTFDDPSYLHGGTISAGFDPNGYYGTFDGPNMAAVMITAESESPDGQRIFVNSARPKIDAGPSQITVQVAQRDQLIGETEVYTTPIVQEVTGEHSILADARYMKFKVNVPVGTVWSHAIGVDIWRKSKGSR